MKNTSGRTLARKLNKNQQVLFARKLTETSQETASRKPARKLTGIMKK